MKTPTRAGDMFPGTKPPRAKPRVMMKGVDHGLCDEDPNCHFIGHMKCQRCGHDAGWMGFKNLTEAKRGYPCPECNKEGGAP